MFQVVEFTRFRLENVNQYIRVVHGYPLGIAQTVYRKRFAVRSFAGEVFNGLHYGAYLAWGVSLTDDKLITYCVVYPGKVCYDDFFSFFILNTFCYLLN